MRFRETPLAGAFVVSLEPSSDVRGYFSRTWCAREFAEQGLPAAIVQSSLSYNRRRGTLRGMHLQLPPSAEAKIVSCARGAIHDVIVDLRAGSPTYLRHFAVELDSSTHDSLYIPPQFAHGFQTLADETEVLYQMTDYYAAELGFGARWNDPAFAIRWPLPDEIVILPRDAGYPDFDSAAYLRRAAQAQPVRRQG